MTDATVTVRVLQGQAVHALGRSHSSGMTFTVPAEQARRLLELDVVEIAEAVAGPAFPELSTADDVEVRIPGGFRSLPRDEARALIAAGDAEPFYPSTLD